MRKLTIALSAIAVAGMTLVSAVGPAHALKCKAPEKWDAKEGKCAKVVKAPVAAKAKKA
jgi:accessory colonization factor AcfC